MLISSIKHFLKQFFIFISKEKKRSNNKSENKNKDKDKKKINNDDDNNCIYKLKVFALLALNLKKKRFLKSRRRREMIKFIINIVNMLFTNFVDPRNQLSKLKCFLKCLL